MNEYALSHVEPRTEIIPRGTKIAAQSPENGYFQCWYPIALSQDLPKGTVIGREFLNGRVVVYRGESGEARVMSAFCRHLGADLSLGSVIGEELRCVYHHWSYAPSGACVRIPAGDKPPARARLFRFPTAERYGIIWAFNGAQPLYDVPDIGVPEESLVLQVKETEILPVEPYVPFSNALDLQHLKVVHGLEVIKLPEHLGGDQHMLEYDISFIVPMLGESEQRIRMYGANSIIITQQFMGRTVHMGSFGRIIPGGRTAITNFVATERFGDGAEADAEAHQLLAQLEAFGEKLNDEDRPVMQTVSFRSDCLSASDRFLQAYLGFAKNFPRSSVVCDLIAP